MCKFKSSFSSAETNWKVSAKFQSAETRCSKFLYSFSKKETLSSFQQISWSFRKVSVFLHRVCNWLNIRPIFIFIIYSIHLSICLKSNTLSVINEDSCYNNKYSKYSKSLFYSVKNIEKYILGLSQHVDQKIKKICLFRKSSFNTVMCVELIGRCMYM